MLAAANTSARPIKQGWVFKKGGTRFLASWRLKYLVLVGNLTNLDAALLQVYDTVDQTRPPKHEIRLNGIDVFEVDNAKGGKKGTAAFVIVDRKRKFHFATQTKSDREEWMSLLQAPVHPAPPLRRSTTLSNGSSGTAYASSASGSPPARRANSLRGYHRSWSRADVAAREDDEMSTYSMGTTLDRDTSDAVSVYSLMSEQDGQCSSVASSKIETLSFCSEPVLTPQELSHMGNTYNPAAESPTPYRNEQAFNFRDTLRRRRVPNVIVDPIQSSHAAMAGPGAELWNDRYQMLLAQRPETEEAALQQDVKLQELIGQFQETTRMTAQRLIDEYHLSGGGSKQVLSTQPSSRAQTPSMTLSSRPMSPAQSSTFTADVAESLGGPPVREAQTVVEDGVVYRFACNYDESTSTQIMDALSRTSSELRAINATNRASFLNTSAQEPGHLHTVLMVLIDYKGFRIVAYADMGLYGQALHVHDLQRDPPRTDERSSERLQVVGRALNLKPHTVQIGQERRVTVFLSNDVQVHFDPPTKLYYVSNLHTLLPIDHHPQNISQPNPSKRLRAEFLGMYPYPLVADGFTDRAGSTRRERTTNDVECARAAKFLQEVWIPIFVGRLDSLEIRPVDSRGLVGEMHSCGINVRYLGSISRNSNLPCVRDMCHIEMVARAFKTLLQTRLRNAILHFRSVGATAIDEEMKTYAATMFCGVLGTGEKSQKYFMEKVREEIAHKFCYDMSYAQFSSLHRPALFLAMQYQCGVSFEDTTEYDFTSPAPVPRTRFVQFQARVKQPSGLAHYFKDSGKIQEDDQLAYHLARHFKSLGPRFKTSRSDPSSAALCSVAAYYNTAKRYEEARLYAQAAVSASTRNSCLVGLAMGQLVESLAGTGFDEHHMRELHGQAVDIVKWCCGGDHPAVMALHDRLARVYAMRERWDEVLEFYSRSMAVAERALGKNHLVTAGYLVKLGIIFHTMRNPSAAIQRFTEALHVYQSLESPPDQVAFLHHHFAQPLAERGDGDAAVIHAQRARKLYEQAFGQADPRTVEAYRQVARLMLAPYIEYEGVLTPVIRAAYKEAIGCYEKVFRFVKGARNHQSSTTYSISSAASVAGGRDSPAIRPTSTSPTTSSFSSRMQQPPSLPLLGTACHPHPIAGPLIHPHKPSLPTHPRSLLHKLTRQIISLKLRLVDSPHHREVVRTLRAQNIDKSLDPGEARQVVLRLAAVSPSVYLDGVLARIEEEDTSAIEELGVVLMLTEGEVIGLAA
ncbi:translation initiation factor eIF3 subunit 135-domain-containing protein [Phlyctochytrium arcticum]|nr:translation initiation factor eIF3 subunit 135-domain-containing protein [Phlyctochytrium arcticum]